MARPLTAAGGRVRLSDQSIINAVAVARPWLVYELPCAWNVQWRNDRRHCLDPEISSDLKLIHFNSPVKEVGGDLLTPDFVALMEKIDQLPH